MAPFWQLVTSLSYHTKFNQTKSHTCKLTCNLVSFSNIMMMMQKQGNGFEIMTVCAILIQRKT